MSVEYPPGINADGPRDPGPEEVRVWHKAEVYKRAAIITLGLLVFYMAVIGTAGVVLIRSQQVSNHELLDTINDCTNKDGKCFAEGQKRTAGAVALITRQSIATAACTVVLSRRSSSETSADHLRRQITRCAHQTLARLDARH